MSGQSIDLATMPLEDVAKLREQVDREMYERRCRAWLPSGPNCHKQKGHDSPHEGFLHHHTTESALQVQHLVTWAPTDA